MAYAILAMVGGVFYREFTRFNNFSGETALGKVHTHFFMLGMFMYLIIALFMRGNDFSDEKLFKVFRAVYNTGVPLTAIMLGVRGVTEVLGLELSKGASAAISGIAGIGHIITGVGIVLLIVTLKKCAVKTSVKAGK
ncbi:MAG: DUF2871 domain-containing protein [Oscillospiraceae bacterium]|nr:DUF2871 domain-containing protein [Oscillospiraceae bacterium]